MGSPKFRVGDKVRLDITGERCTVMGVTPDGDGYLYRLLGDKGEQYFEEEWSLENADPRKRPIPYGILPDWAIREYIKITPFAECQKRPGVISYGLGHFGYDFRLGTKFRGLNKPERFVGAQSMAVMKAHHERQIVDPKNTEPYFWGPYEQTERFALDPGEYILGELMERIEMPDDVIGIALGKSTYARCGIIANVTPLEPGWKGILTIELSNTGKRPVWLYPGEGILQIVFLRGQRPDVTYAAKGGKYQDQQGVTVARVD